MSDINWEAPKLKETLNSLPEDLHEPFRRLVEEITFHAKKRGWYPYRHWPVLADLVREGWRPKDKA